MQIILAGMTDMQRQYAAREIVDLAARGITDDEGRPLYTADEVAVARSHLPTAQPQIIMLDYTELPSPEQRQWDRYIETREWETCHV